MATCSGHNRRAPHGKNRPRLAKRRNGEEAKGRPSPSHTLASLTICWKTSSNRLGTQTSGEMQYMSSSPAGANLKTGLRSPFLRLNTLRTCARKSMAGLTYVPSVSSSRNIFKSLSAQIPQRYQTSTDLSPFWRPRLTYQNSTLGKAIKAW